MTIEELGVFGLTNKLCIGKSMGLSEMHPRLLERLANFVADPLVIRSNLSVTHGRLP